MNDRWIDITTIGDNYQVEMSEDGQRFRHRRMSLGTRIGRDKVGSEPMEREWIPGRPPSGVNSQ